MKTILPILSAFLLCSCTSIKVDKQLADGTHISASATSLFSNTTLKGLQVDGSTKTATNLLKVSTSQTEPNSESIIATGSSIGELIGTVADHLKKP